MIYPAVQQRVVKRSISPRLQNYTRILKPRSSEGFGEAACVLVGGVTLVGVDADTAPLFFFFFFNGTNCWNVSSFRWDFGLRLLKRANFFFNIPTNTSSRAVVAALNSHQLHHKR